MPQFKSTILTLLAGQSLLGLATAKSNSTYQSCTYENLGIFNGVGKARIKDAPSSLSGASLLKGVSITNTGKDDGKKAVHSVYFFEKPDGLDIADLSGCIVAFTNPSGDAFNGMDDKSQTCPDTMTQKCIGGLTARAKEVVSGGQGCAALSDQLKPDSVSECDSVSKGLGEFTVTSLADLTPMTGSEVKHTLSKCWSEFSDPKDLAGITHSTVTSRESDKQVNQNLYKITPILTVFDTSNQTSAQLTCLHVDNTDANNSSGNTGDSLAPTISYNLVGVGIAILASVFGAML